MDIESLAVSAVETSISKTDLLSSFINEKDVEPVWDGNIYIYANNKKSKKNIKRVPTQVKGEINNNLTAEEISYSIEVADLEAYQRDGGVIFFVVYIDATGDNTQIYYASLLPVRLRSILSTKKGQISASFKLKKFPDDKETKTAIFLNFHDDMKKQTSFAQLPPISLEDLSQKGLLEAVTISLTKCSNDPRDVRDLIFLGDTYLYAKVKGSDVLQPIDAIPSDSKRIEEKYGIISVDRQEYYTKYHIVTTKNESQLWIGKSLYFSKDDKNNIIGIKIVLTTNLQDALIDYPFLLSLIEKKVITINGISANINFFLDQFPTEKLIFWKKNYEYCKWIAELFDTLRLDKNYDLAQMSDDDRNNSRMLYDALICGHCISGIQEDNTHLLLLKFLNTSIPLIFSKTDKPGTFYVSDFFKDEAYKIVHLIDGDVKPTSRFNILTPENLLEIGNVDYEEITSSYIQYSEEPYCFSEANVMLLKMILAYDKSSDLRKDILYNAEKFAVVIHQEIAKEEEKIISHMNLLQIKKRINNFLPEKEQDWLISVAEGIVLDDKNLEYAYRFGANLLLDNQRAAKYYYEKMSKESQDEYKELPIYRFFTIDNTPSDQHN